MQDHSFYDTPLKERLLYNHKITVMRLYKIYLNTHTKENCSSRHFMESLQATTSLSHSIDLKVIRLSTFLLQKYQ